MECRVLKRLPIVLQSTPEILALAISLDKGIAKLTAGEQELALQRMEAILRVRMKVTNAD